MIKNTQTINKPLHRVTQRGWLYAIALGFLALGFAQSEAKADTSHTLLWKPGVQSQLDTTEVGFKGGFRSRGFGKFGGHRFGKFRGSRFGKFRGRGFSRFRGRGFGRFGGFRGSRFGGFRGRGFGRFH